MKRVLVCGVGMTHFGKFAGRTVRSLAEQATVAALKDAGVETSSVEAVYFANAVGGLITGQEMIRGQAALRATGLLGVPFFNVENACASSSSAFHLAWSAVASGQYDCVLVVGAEKLSHDDKQYALRAIESALDLEEFPPGAAGGTGRSFFMDLYAQTALAYMERSGATAADFADISVKNHQHGAANPGAQYRNLVTREEVLGSREIAPPLTLLMCSPVGDGAAAAVLCSDRAAKARSSLPIQVLASAVTTGTDLADSPTAAARAAARAFDTAGLDPADLDVIELHDAAAPAELILYEDLGLCAMGDGPRLLASGATRQGGSGPVVNPSGGLLSKGHPIGATGLAQIAEITWQLRGQAGDRQVVPRPRLGLTENGGGWLGSDGAIATVHILGDGGRP